MCPAIGWSHRKEWNTESTKRRDELHQSTGYRDTCQVPAKSKKCRRVPSIKSGLSLFSVWVIGHSFIMFSNQIRFQRSSVLGNKIEMEITELIEKNSSLLRLGLHLEFNDARHRIANHLQRNIDRSESILFILFASRPYSLHIYYFLIYLNST